MGYLSDTWDSLTGKAQSEGASIAGEAEREEITKGLDYLMERDSLGNVVGDKALSGLSDIYLGDGSAQQGLIDKAEASPLYQRLMSSKQQGEDAIMRNASATGGLRSGNVQADMYDYNMRFDAEALDTAYSDQLSGMSGLMGVGDQNSANIANLYGSLGESRANQATAQADAKGNLLENGLAIAGTVGSFFSDPRLKESIREVGVINGHRIFQWKWNDEAEKHGLVGTSVGVLAHLINEYLPEAIDTARGYLTVNYERLGLDHGVMNSLAEAS